jgi:hypothetical protein
LIKTSGREIFLIAVRGPARRAKKAGAFVPTQGRKLRLFFPPPYMDRTATPGALVCKHGKAAGRMAETSKEDFEWKIAARYAVRSTQIIRAANSGLSRSCTRQARSQGRMNQLA